MYVEFTTRPVPEIETGDNPRTRLEAIRDAGAPLLAIRGAGVQPDQLWESTVDSIREAGFAGTGSASNFYISDGLGLAAGSMATESQDESLHLDLPPTHDFEVATIRMHQLLGGAYTARFFEIAEQYAPGRRLIRWDYFARTRLPVGTDVLYRQGLVNPEVLSPEGYEFEARQGDIIIFRQGGRRPVAHNFQTTVFPRSFRVTGFVVEKPQP